MGVALALRMARLVCASAVRRFSAARATVVTLLRPVGQSWAIKFQVLGLIFRSTRESLRQSLRRFFYLPSPTEHLPRQSFAYSSCFGMVISHSGDMASPSSLGFLSEGVNTGDVGPF